MGNTSDFALADRIRLNPGGANEEDATIAGFGSLILSAPLKFDHTASEAVVSIAGPAVSVGGIAEQPQVIALPSAKASSSGAMAIALGGATLVVLVVVGVGGWYVRRRRAG